jgi:glyoxylase-like metal-dependent hydrolase (beta-lactamase superfamily II)
LTDAGDVVAVATPGHTTDHISVLVECDGTTYFLAGDTSYDERLMLARRIDLRAGFHSLADGSLTEPLLCLGHLRPDCFALVLRSFLPSNSGFSKALPARIWHVSA